MASEATNKPTLTTDQKEEQQDLDFISLLPDDILHTILSKLQIRDAAVTTAVSKRWSPLFPTLPSLKINAFSFNPRAFFHDLYVEQSINWVDALFSVLDSRKTAVKKFDIHVDMGKLDFDPVDLVCVAGVEELTIFNNGFNSLYDTPLSMFNCNTIVKLKICFCRIVVPSQLTGLRSVKSLVLTEVIVADDDLQRMISWCKAMEKLSIDDCLEVKNIVIYAPNLLELVIRLGRPVGVVLKSVPRLVSMTILFDYDPDPEEYWTDDEDICYSEKTFEWIDEATNILAFLHELRRVENLRLEFSNEYRMILSKNAMTLPTRLSPKCYLVELKKLWLRLPFDYNTFNIIVSWLLNSSPHLMEIIISEDMDLHEYEYHPNDLELNFWEKQLPAKCVKHHLTTATFYFSEGCFGFPKFLLQNAGNLKNMNLCVRNLWNMPNEAEKIKNELFAIQKASPDVEIMIKINFCLVLNGSTTVGDVDVDMDLLDYKYRPNDLELNFWEKQLPPECVKHHLTTATFYLDDYLEGCFGFPKFILLNAGNLKNMNLFFAGSLKNMPNKAEKIKNELFAIQMASPDVEIIDQTHH